MTADSERLSRHPRRGLAEALVVWGRRRKGKTTTVSVDRVFLCRPKKTDRPSSVDKIMLAMPSRGCPVPPEGRRWEPAKSHCADGFAGGPTVARCSGSAVIETGATDTAATDAARKRDGNNGGPLTGDTSKAGRDGSITATGDGRF